MTRILEDDLFENYRFFEEDSKINQLVSKEIQVIFNKLFKGTEANADDFYFTIFDDEDSGAFFIDKSYTLEKKKNIVAISHGLIKDCQNEAQLAGILGHELSHYLWHQILGGRNTIFQEHAADLRAVDLLIKGGYNPREHVVICEKILGQYGRVKYSDLSLEVHGNGLARIDDINDYLTKIANEQGDFPPLENKEDTDYVSFQSSVARTLEQEEYDTYIEKCLKAKFGTKDLTKISAQDALQLMLSEMQQGNITPEKTCRFLQMFSIVRSYAENEAFTNKTTEMTKLCQDFFLEISQKIENTPREKLQNLKDPSEYLQNLKHHNFLTLKSFKLQKFGDFITQSNNIEHFVNYQNKEDAVHWAEEMYKLRWTLPYAHAFTDDTYAYLKARKEENIGRLLPWEELKSFVAQEKKNRALKWAFDALVYREYSRNETYSTQRNDPDYNPATYFLDENGVVLVYGEEAIRMNKDAELARKNAVFLRECAYNRQCMEDDLHFYDTLALFDISDNEQEKNNYAQQMLQMLSKSINSRFPIIRQTHQDNPHYLRNPEIEKIKKIYRNSPAVKYFVSTEDSLAHTLQDEVDYKYRKESLEYRSQNNKRSDEDYHKYLLTLDDKDVVHKIQNHCNISANITQKQKICMTFIRLATHLREQGNDEGCALVHEALKHHIGTDFHIYAYNVSDIEKTSEYKQVKNTYELNSEDLETFFNRSRVKSPQTIKNMFVSSNNFNDFDYYIMSEISNNLLKSSPLLDEAMKTMGFDPAASFSENLATLDDYIGDEIKIITGYTNSSRAIYENKKLENSFYDEDFSYFDKLERTQPCYDLINFYKHAGILMLANTIKRGETWDLKETMKYLRFCEASSFYKPYIPDMIAESIQQGNKFYSLPLADKIYVYEVMEKVGLFSEKYANKNEFLKEIVKEIINLPDRNKAMEYAEKLLSKQYVAADFTGRKNFEIEFAREKKLLVSFYAKGIADSLGIDDGSNEFLAKATQAVDDMLADITFKDRYNRDTTEEKFSRDTKNDILNEIANFTVSQELTTNMFASKGIMKVSGDDAEKYDLYARGALALVSALAKSPEHAKVIIDFLSSKCTDKSMDKVFASIPEDYDLRRGKNVSIDRNKYGIDFDYNLVFDKSTLQMLHENFWAANLPARAYIMKRILNAYTSHEQTKETKESKKLDLVVDMYFDKQSPYYKDAKDVVTAVYNNLQDYEKDLILGALVAANQKDDNNQQTGGETIGEGLKMFFENKGPAFVKFGQMLSYLPQLDPDIRRPLAKLRDKADLPTRSELFGLLKETLPNEELSKISRVDKILGAGSFFITAKINYDGKDCVVALMRPFAKEISASGMEMINNTIDCLAKKDSKYAPLKNIAYQAKLSSESETDIDADYAKYQEAIRIYDDIHISTQSGDFKPNVAKWESYGAGKDGKVYKIMNMAEGVAMTSDKMSVQQKHDAAVAYVTLELCNLLSGVRWDTDRHQGQQNFSEQTRENGFKNFIIGIFDTGAQIQHDPSKRDKIILGEMLYGMARAARTGRDFSEYMITKVKKIDKIGKKLKIDTLYIDEVQRGLTALSDIINYQKEIKDENGNVVQEGKSLNGQEISEIVNSILASGLVDRTVMKTLKAKVILNKLRPLRKGWISSLSEGIKKIAPTIKIEKNDTPEKMQSYSIERKDKPQAEIDACVDIDNSKRVLGVNTSHIQPKKSHSDNNSALAALKRRVTSRVLSTLHH